MFSWHQQETHAANNHSSYALEMIRGQGQTVVEKARQTALARYLNTIRYFPTFDVNKRLRGLTT